MKPLLLPLALCCLVVGLIAYVHREWPKPVEEITVPLGLVGSKTIRITNDGTVYASQALTNVALIVDASNVIIANCAFFYTRWSTRSSVTFLQGSNTMTGCLIWNQETNVWR